MEASEKKSLPLSCAVMIRVQYLAKHPSQADAANPLNRSRNRRAGGGIAGERGGERGGRGRTGRTGSTGEDRSGLDTSGGYERGIIRALLAAGQSVRRINPKSFVSSPAPAACWPRTTVSMRG